MDCLGNVQIINELFKIMNLDAQEDLDWGFMDVMSLLHLQTKMLPLDEAGSQGVCPRGNENTPSLYLGIFQAPWGGRFERRAPVGGGSTAVHASLPTFSPHTRWPRIPEASGHGSSGKLSLPNASNH